VPPGPASAPPDRPATRTPVTLESHVAAASARLGEAHAAREAGLAACRAVIRSSGSAIRAVHLRQPEAVAARLADAEASLERARVALAPFPAVAHAGFLHDAAKEYAEARCTVALVAGDPVPGPQELGVEDPAWLNGLAEPSSASSRVQASRSWALSVRWSQAWLIANECDGRLVRPVALVSQICRSARPRPR
jgi:translin